jgi:hypothetical protein
MAAQAQAAARLGQTRGRLEVALAASTAAEGQTSAVQAGIARHLPQARGGQDPGLP